MKSTRTIATVLGIVSLFCGLSFVAWYFGRTLFALWLISVAAGNAIDRGVAMRSGYRCIPEAKQIDDLLGPADHSVMNEGAETDAGVQEEWISEVYFGGRYHLNMRVDILVDRKTSQVVKVVGPSEFTLQEIASIDFDGNRITAIQYHPENYWKFDADQWRKIVEANGDFAVIGIELNRTALLNFRELVKWSRATAQQRYRK
jgi:hypothetical protein